MTEKEGLISGTGRECELGRDDIFRIVFDHIQTGILVIDPVSHTIMDANPIAEEMIGLPRGRLIGNPCHGFVCPAEPGQCPVTDLHKEIDRSEQVLINARSEKIPILKTIAKAKVAGREYLVESFVDITDRKRAEDRRIALIAYMDEAVSRVSKPMELTIANLQNIVDTTKTGVYDNEDLRMQLQIQTNNLQQMAKNLQEISAKVTREETGIPEAFRKYISGK